MQKWKKCHVPWWDTTDLLFDSIMVRIVAQAIPFGMNWV